jgi:hypothetical protein
MAKRRFVSVLAMSAAASAVLGGVPAAVYATTAMTGGASQASAPGFGPLTPALTAQLSRGAGKPVIVVLKSQPAEARVGSAVAGVRADAVTASQASLVSELNAVGATRIRQFTLVNSVAATVSALEEARLARDPAVAAIVADATVTIPGPAQPGPALPATIAAAARSTSLPPHNIPGACAAKNKVQLAPEGLGLTRTAGGPSTAQGLGFTGKGVKVAYIADGLDRRNPNFLRADRSSVFTDYKDFTGDGPAAPTTGGEAFLDANTIAGQGRTVYNVNGFSAQSYPGTCNVVIRGVAPGAELIGLDVFSGDAAHPYVTTNSMMAEAINYAVEKDHVNVLNESFGGSPFADSTVDVVRLFDEAATKAGVVVTVSTGDAGTTSTIGSPATDPDVISVGATTQFQAYAQANLQGARYFASKGWIDNNISAFSSAGFDQAGKTVDMVAPGDLSWASCDANLARYTECSNNRGKGSPIEEAGGTSESSPFVAGAAALVIQAYRKTHGNATPPPSLVKEILLSTATDVGAPAQEQGTGLLNTGKAVLLAQSYGRSSRKGSTLFVTGADQLNDISLPGVTKSWKVTLANTGSGSQTVKLGARTLGADANVQAGHVTLSDSASNQYTSDTGGKDNYATFNVTVPRGKARLDVSIAYNAPPNQEPDPVAVELIDPAGRLAASSQPQGVGNYGNVEVAKPTAGTWRAIVASATAADGGYNGKVFWRAATEKYVPFGSLSAKVLVLAPGQSRSFVYSVTAPRTAGDLSGSVLLSSSTGGVTTIPVTVRSLVNVAAGGTFRGVLTGGNGRGLVGQDNYYSFDVPAGTQAITAKATLSSNPGFGNYVGAFLVSPDGNTLGYGQNYALGTQGSTNRSLAATAVSPAAGRWTLIVAFAEPTPGLTVQDQFSGSVSFTAGAVVAAPAIPATLKRNATYTLPVTITNNTGATEDFFVDPRLTATGALPLVPVSPSLEKSSNTYGLPLNQNAALPFYFVPSHSTSLTVRQTSTVPATTEISLATGDPDRAQLKCTAAGTVGTVGYTPPGGAVATGPWQASPTECGPFPIPAKTGKATDTVTVTTRKFDTQVSAKFAGGSVPDLMETALSAAVARAALASPSIIPVELAPGQTATVNVLFKPTAAVGSTVAGTLYLDTEQTAVPPDFQFDASEVAAIPYSYKVG